MNELQLALSISRIASESQPATIAIARIAGELVKFPGVRGARIQPNDALFGLVEGPLAWGEVLGQSASARAAVQAGARQFGELHIYFDLNTAAADRPVRLVQFVAEQLGRVLAACQLEQEREEFARDIDTAKEQLAFRKAYHRARGLVARQHQVSELAAAEILRRRAAQNGQALETIVTGLIENYERRRPTPGLARRSA